MNRTVSRRISLLFIACLFLEISTFASDFSIKEYDDFHRVLHPLEREALPKNDFAAIRSKATELIVLGESVVKLNVPAGVKSEHASEFKKELENFRGTLENFRSAAKSGTDDQLKSTFSAVHDSFEMLAALVPANSSAAKRTDRPRTVIYNGAATQVAMDAESSNDLWITTADLKRATGFVIKPQGVCRDELCFPLPKNRKAAFVKKQGSTQWFNLSEFARLIGQPIASDHKNDVWCFGPRAAEQNGYITSLEAPDFTLPDMNGRQHSLKDFRGKKLLLITWASW